MRLYLDTNVILGLLTRDALTERARALFSDGSWTAVLSDFAAADFASAVARRVRTGEIDAADARSAFANLDAWSTRSSERIEVSPADVRRADAILRRLDLPPRTPDALHVALAERAGATLATFDAHLAASATALGLPIAS